MTDYAAVLTRLYPNLQWTLNDNDYEQLVMLDDAVKPTKKSLDDAWPSVQAEVLAEKLAKVEKKAALLERLGLTADEAALLIS